MAFNYDDEINTLLSRIFTAMTNARINKIQTTNLQTREREIMKIVDKGRTVNPDDIADLKVKLYDYNVEMVRELHKDLEEKKVICINQGNLNKYINCERYIIINSARPHYKFNLCNQYICATCHQQVYGWGHNMQDYYRYHPGILHNGTEDCVIEMI